MILDIRKIYSYFRRRWGVKKSTNGWFSMECPFGCVGSEGKKKFAVSFEKEYVKCWRCPYRCSVTDFVMDNEGVSYFEAKQIINTEDSVGAVDAEMFQSIRVIAESHVNLPEGFKTILDGDGIMAERARAYLLGRGFDLTRLDRKGFGYCDVRAEEEADNYFGYLIMPFKREGMLRYFIGRDFLLDQFLRYKNPPTQTFGVGKADLLYNEDALFLFDEVWLFEGIWDAETMGDMAMASQGWSLSVTQKGTIMRSGVKRLVFAPDKDFYKAAVKTAMGFLDVIEEVYVINADNIPGKGKDCNELGKEAYLAEYKKTKQLTFSMAMAVITD